MKKIALFICLLFCVTGCKKTEQPSQPVSFSIGFQMPQAGNMARSVDNLYQKFYDEQIKTKQLVYPSYELSFYRDDVLVATFTGKWDADAVQLPAGTYIVRGKSGNYEKISSDLDLKEERYSTASLKFEESVTITEDTKSITLTAAYDCYMVFFDASQFTEVWAGKMLRYYGDDMRIEAIPAPSASGIQYVFINSATTLDKITYTSANGDRGEIQMAAFNFENGKYYGFDSANITIDVPPMESGL